MLEAHDGHLADLPSHPDQLVRGRSAPRVDHQHPEPVLDGSLTLVLVDDFREALFAVAGGLDHLPELIALFVVELSVRRRGGFDELRQPVIVPPDELVQENVGAVLGVPVPPEFHCVYCLLGIGEL